MNYGWREFLGDWSGYRSKYLDSIKLLDVCSEDKIWLVNELSKAQELIVQLKLLVPRENPPELNYIVEKDTVWVQEQVDSMGLEMFRHPLDMSYRLTNRSNMLNVIAWDTTDQIQYVREKFDCENFALLFKSMVDLVFRVNQVAVIMDYISKHSYNLILFDNGKHMVFEPQSDGLYVWTQRLTQFYSMKGAVCVL